MTVHIRENTFDAFNEIRNYQQNTLNAAGKYGATSLFIGSMRDFNQNDNVQSMTLEHYPGMTEPFLEKLSQDAVKRWDLLDSLIIHRVGTVKPDDTIVVVAVWSAHRAAAFDACRYLMEELKSRAPFWKKETLTEGERWVGTNTPG